MEKYLHEIRQVISTEIDRRINNSDFMGEKFSISANELENEVSWFMVGIETAIVAVTESDKCIDVMSTTLFEVPLTWEKFFKQQDPEYKEYLRLKTKFEEQ